MRKRLVDVLKLVLSAGLLVLLLRRVGLQPFRELAAASLPLLGLAFAVYVGGIALRALRWQALLRAHRVEAPTGRLVVLYYVGSFFNIMLPTAVGGDAVRAYELARYHCPGEIAVGTVLVDRAIGLVMLLLLAAAALPLSAGMLAPWIVWLVLGLAATSTTALAILLWGRPLVWVFGLLPSALRKLLDRPVVHKLYRAFTGYDGRSLVVAAAVSLAFNLLLIAVNLLIGRALDVHVRFAHYFVFISLISAVSALPISFGGLGVREGGYSLLFGQVGVASATAVSMSLAFYLINVLSGAIGGLLYAWEGARGVWRPKEGEAQP